MSFSWSPEKNSHENLRLKSVQTNFPELMDLPISDEEKIARAKAISVLDEYIKNPSKIFGNNFQKEWRKTFTLDSTVKTTQNQINTVRKNLTKTGNDDFWNTIISSPIEGINSDKSINFSELLDTKMTQRMFLERFIGTKELVAIFPKYSKTKENLNVLQDDIEKISRFNRVLDAIELHDEDVNKNELMRTRQYLQSGDFENAEKIFAPYFEKRYNMSFSQTYASNNSLADSLRKLKYYSEAGQVMEEEAQKNLSSKEKISLSQKEEKLQTNIENRIQSARQDDITKAEKMYEKIISSLPENHPDRYAIEQNKEAYLQGLFIMDIFKTEMRDFITKNGSDGMNYLYEKYNDMEWLHGWDNWSDKNVDIASEAGIFILTTALTFGTGTILSLTAKSLQAIKNIKFVGGAINMTSKIPAGVAKIDKIASVSKLHTLYTAGKFTVIESSMREVFRSEWEISGFENFFEKLAINTTMFTAFAGMEKFFHFLPKKFGGIDPTKPAIFSDTLKLSLGDITIMQALHAAETGQLEWDWFAAFQALALRSGMQIVKIFPKTAKKFQEAGGEIPEKGSMETQNTSVKTEVEALQKLGKNPKTITNQEMRTNRILDMQTRKQNTKPQQPPKQQNSESQKANNTETSTNNETIIANHEKIQRDYKFVSKWKKLEKEINIKEAQKYIHLNDAERIIMAEKLLGDIVGMKIKLTPEQATALIKAHNTGTSGIGNFTQAELKAKVKILKEGGFNEIDRKILIKNGLAGKPVENQNFLGEFSSTDSIPSGQNKWNTIKVDGIQYRWNVRGNFWWTNIKWATLKVEPTKSNKTTVWAKSSPETSTKQQTNTEQQSQTKNQQSTTHETNPKEKNSKNTNPEEVLLIEKIQQTQEEISMLTKENEQKFILEHPIIKDFFKTHRISNLETFAQNLKTLKLREAEYRLKFLKKEPANIRLQGEYLSVKTLFEKYKNINSLIYKIKLDVSKFSPKNSPTKSNSTRKTQNQPRINKDTEQRINKITGVNQKTGIKETDFLSAEEAKIQQLSKKQTKLTNQDMRSNRILEQQNIKKTQDMTLFLKEATWINPEPLMKKEKSNDLKKYISDNWNIFGSDIAAIGALFSLARLKSENPYLPIPDIPENPTPEQITQICIQCMEWELSTINFKRHSAANEKIILTEKRRNNISLRWMKTSEWKNAVDHWNEFLNIQTNFDENFIKIIQNAINNPNVENIQKLQRCIGMNSSDDAQSQDGILGPNTTRKFEEFIKNIKSQYSENS